MILGFVIQHRLKTTVAQQMQVQIANGMTGEQVARMILDHNGLSGVPVQQAQGGPLSDHYDPRQRTVNLSPGVYDGQRCRIRCDRGTRGGPRDPAREGLRAVQGSQRDVPRGRVRVADLDAPSPGRRVPAGRRAGAGRHHPLRGRRALPARHAPRRVRRLASGPSSSCTRSGSSAPARSRGSSKVLSAAAMTYVAGALAALSQLAYFAMMFLGNRN